MKAIIAGGRDFKGTKEHLEWLLRLKEELSITEIVSGGASGADRFGECFACDENLQLTEFRAQWDKYGQSAGPRRNLLMAKYADICILFPGGSGTRSMLECAKQEGLHIVQWEGGEK